MGRPLFSTTLSAPVPAVRIAEADQTVTPFPTFEKWSYLNSFDPDSDEFLDGDDVVYEAFLTDEEIAAREQQARTLLVPEPPTVVRVSETDRLQRVDTSSSLISPVLDSNPESNATSGRTSPDSDNIFVVRRSSESPELERRIPTQGDAPSALAQLVENSAQRRMSSNVVAPPMSPTNFPNVPRVVRQLRSRRATLPPQSSVRSSLDFLSSLTPQDTMASLSPQPYPVREPGLSPSSPVLEPSINSDGPYYASFVPRTVYVQPNMDTNDAESRSPSTPSSPMTPSTPPQQFTALPYTPASAAVLSPPLSATPRWYTWGQTHPNNSRMFPTSPSPANTNSRPISLAHLTSASTVRVGL